MSKKDSSLASQCSSDGPLRHDFQHQIAVVLRFHCVPVSSCPVSVLGSDSHRFVGWHVAHVYHVDVLIVTYVLLVCVGLAWRDEYLELDPRPVLPQDR